MTELPLLSPFSPPATISGGQGYFDLVIRSTAAFHNHVTAEHGVQTREGPSNEDSIKSILDYTAATVDRLQRLVVVLQDPTPIDLIGQDSPTNADREDVELVSGMFPQAAGDLVQRLGKANWKRRQYLKDIRLIMQQQSYPNRNQIYRNRRSLLKTGTVESRLPGKGFLPAKDQARPLTDRRMAFSRYTSDSEIMSQSGSSQSTAGPAASTAGTSVSDSTEPAKPILIPVPEPPLPLDEGNAFQCPYCAHLLIVGKDIAADDDDDWIQHVFADIEPYMCTFANDPRTCIKVDKTFGSRKTWFAHELDAHRSKMVWYCQSCVREFQTEDSFGSHVLRFHDHRLDSDQVSLIASLCKRYSISPGSSEPCPLCKVALYNAERFCAHLAVHFEQIALTSMPSKVATEEAAPASPIYVTTPSDYGYRANLPNIDYFVFEGPKRLVAEGRDSRGRMNHGLKVVQTGEVHAVNLQEATRSPQELVPATTSVRPAMTPRGASYSLLEQARNLRNTITGQDSPSQNPARRQSVPTLIASSCIRTMTPPKNQDFVGRRNDMAKVHHALELKGNICILNGVGGLGKSALAVEYTYLFEPGYDYIFWVQAETPMRCAEAYSQIALVCVPDTDLAQEQDRLVMLSREFLEQTTKRWLLVFDNVDHWRTLQNFLPESMSTTSGSVLITANKVDTSSFTSDMRHTIIDLGTLGLDESRSLLLNATSLRFQGDFKDHPEYKLAGEVAKMAERLPLALSLIAGYMLVSNLTLTQFVELWNERPMNVPSDAGGTDQRNTDPDMAMDNVWSIGLREVSSDARELLNILAFFDSDNIQKDLLVGPHTDPLLESLHSSGVAR
jgi:hypothetical protein